jgi:alpha-N-arabinofuranosidase
VKEKRVPMNIDEWAYTRMPPNLKMALSYAWALNEMFRHTDFIKMAAYTFATSCIEWNATDAVFNAAGLLFKLYRDHFGVIPVQVGGDSPQPSRCTPWRRPSPASTPAAPPIRWMWLLRSPPTARP